jgi:hypothetical protein
LIAVTSYFVQVVSREVRGYGKVGGQASEGGIVLRKISKTKKRITCLVSPIKLSLFYKNGDLGLRKGPLHDIITGQDTRKRASFPLLLKLARMS